MKFKRRHEPPIKALVVKQSVSIRGHHTSASLEGAFWNALKSIAAGQDMGAAELIAKIDSAREVANLSSTIRLFVREHYRDQP
jgi:predicted DNA-binding ribbon-helix-helix protein